MPEGRVKQPIAGKRVLITGASSGIGRETAVALAKEGAHLILCARREQMLQEVAEQCRDAAEVLPMPVDVADEQQVTALKKNVEKKLGTVDCLVNAAGFGIFSPLLDLNVRDFDEMISVNLKGTFLMCQAFVPAMVERGEGQVLNLISIAGKETLPGCGGYGASKFGVLGLTRVMSAELRSKGIRVTAVLAGSVHTPFWDGIESPPNLAGMIPAITIADTLVSLIAQPPTAVVDELTITPPLGIL